LSPDPAGASRVVGAAPRHACGGELGGRARERVTSVACAGRRGSRILTRMPELVAIWLAGLVLLLVVFGVAGALLRYTPSGRAQRMPLGDLFKVLVVCVGLICAVYTLIALIA
jgi:hypothetical protein